MANTQSPYELSPPPLRRLLVSSALAIGLALAVLTIVILPAEYAIDPTGLGKVLGLSGLAPQSADAAVPATPQGVMSLATIAQDAMVANDDFREPAPLPDPALHQSHDAVFKSQQLEITMAPGEQMEFKALMGQGQVMVYSWAVDRGDLYFDFHAEPYDGPPDYWVRYQEGDGLSSAHGSLTAPFDGRHGWFWLNYNDFPVTITLQIAGYYDELRELGRSSVF